MFNDIGGLELIALVVLAVLIFGPDKLPKVIQDVSSFIRKIRAFSESAKQDIREELGPEFKDFEFEDLNPKKFVRKQLDQHGGDLGIDEIRNGFNLKKEMAEVTDAVNSRESESSSSAGGTKTSLTKGPETSPAEGPDLEKKPAQDDRPPFDADAT
ncbi:Sec-independent protein translocase subunit TatB [Streptomyces sp. YC504]|uniref:Sec-independent protein translocase protein TatB n=1 Tax=Streptomyces mesophilus TaxID=1775132 RepID=A0A6G4XV54_9ACTN|nr:sec-independent translocase [Streptomyces mesophilus]NGO81103.1 Sec-independent protein translocase subunit TatB [Streptomyces mesophilus]